MEELKWVPSTVDVTRPSVARMYDYYLGGSHNFEADRAAAKQVEQIFPGVAQSAQANRSFLRRVVRHLMTQGVDQFLDLGSGIPTVGNVHEIAQHDNPDARVVYVDFEPVAVSHSNALLADNPNANAILADLRATSTVLAGARETLDFSRPVGVLVIAALHFVSDTDSPYEAIAEYMADLPAGSYLAITHATWDTLSEEELAEAREVAKIYSNSDNKLTMRTHAEVTRFFDGMEMLEPGVVAVNDWRPDSFDEAHVGIYGAVGRKP
ncbi:SAM-dependent methyltransferase [Lentzea sp. BCCO 10_0061]|uniref:SAM-dependent methyltransferase n=1 Tax=Lentzea sokolovensis TaxID=3095429 RepID=A0ABU4V356_9PSEU|nr:SAM-dependent methyltransferase [Lentzea sp. BCCO 10_0061]MDX8145351.1 SAM-dependent methyltransferase [Lentzea sp. BCCO 10_0061]